MVAAIKRWAMAFPHELTALEVKVKQMRQREHKSNGISRDGNLRHVAEIPVTLVNFLRRVIAQDWDHDPLTREMFYRHFKVGLVATGERSKK
jgi:hypothetical protein